MKRSRTLLAFLVCVLAIFGGCSRKQLYLMVAPFGDRMSVNTLFDAGMTTDILWGADWDAEIKYDWSTTNLGKLGYTKPDLATGWFMSSAGTKASTGQRVLAFRKMFYTGGTTKVDMVINASYDILFHTDLSSVKLTVPPDHSRFDLRALPDEEKGYEFEDGGFPDMKQPGEIFSVFLEDINLARDYPDVTPEIDGDELVYVYKLNAVLSPITYIYVVQIVIVDDNGKSPDVDSISYITLDGLSAGRNMLFQKPSKERCDITTEDISRLDIGKDSTLFVSRMLTFGLPYYTDDGNISWVIVDNATYRMGAQIKMTDGSVRYLLADITGFMNKHPKGGVYTVFINKSELQKKDEGGGFVVDVEDWVEDVNIEINI